MTLNEWGLAVAPLTWYQQIMFTKTLNAFEDGVSIVQALLEKLDVNFDSQNSIHDNIINSGSIGYNYIIDNAPLSRISFSLDNHGINENYGLIITENGKITSVSSYFSNAKYKIEQVKRKMSQNMSNNSRNQFYVFSTCICNTQPRNLLQNKGSFCLDCYNSWTPQNNCFYPELLSDGVTNAYPLDNYILM